MTRAYCLTCNEQVDVSDGRCPRGHEVSADDLGPQPWIGRALSAVGNAPDRPAAAQDDRADIPVAAPSADDDASTADDTDETEGTDELAALLADLDDGGPADLVTDDDSPPAVPADAPPDLTVDEAADTSSELAALAEELALRADTDSDEDPDDDTLGALDEAIIAWDESDEAIVAPSETVPDDGESSDESPVGEIPPPPPSGAEPPTASPPPPPPSEDDLFARDEVDELSPPAQPPVEEPPVEQPPAVAESASVEEPPAEEPAAEESPAQEARSLDLTNFTASGNRIDTSSTPRKRGLFGLGR